jgi:hypothetical protein
MRMIAMVAAAMLFADVGCGSTRVFGRTRVSVTRPSHPIYESCRNDHPFDVRQILGLTPATGAARLNDHGCRLRVVEEDGRFPPLTADVVGWRINVAVKGDRIVRIDGRY